MRPVFGSAWDEAVRHPRVCFVGTSWKRVLHHREHRAHRGLALKKRFILFLVFLCDVCVLSGGVLCGEPLMYFLERMANSGLTVADANV